LAQRLHAAGYEVLIGSRDPTKASDAARSVANDVMGLSNDDAAAQCDAAAIAVPYSGHRLLLEAVADSLNGKIVIDTTVPIDPTNIFQTKTESGKSAAEETAASIPGADVFAAFQTISHRVLRDLNKSHQVLVVGGTNRKNEVMDLIRSLKLRPIDAGPIAVAAHLERMTVLLLSINKANKVKESGIEITGI
jgi:NADPH-dependent F420 reductase